MELLMKILIVLLSVFVRFRVKLVSLNFKF